MQNLSYDLLHIKNKTLRILDANINRLKEGLRVIEDILRFIYDDKESSLEIKNLRHKAMLKHEHEILESRDTSKDVGKVSIKSEKIRDGVNEILSANFHRIFESARVLEEILKLEHCYKYGDSETFKYIRYQAYELHKKILMQKN